MTKLYATIAFAFMAVLASAQTNRFPPINLYTGDPTGVACTIPNSLVQSTTTEGIYGCTIGGVYAPLPPDATKLPLTGGTINGNLNVTGNATLPNIVGPTTLTGLLNGTDATFSDTVAATTETSCVNNRTLNPTCPTYGADPTGVADSTSAINTACSVAYYGNLQVKLPAGIYKVSGQLTNCGSLPIGFFGSGVANTIIKNYSTTAYIFPVTYSILGGGTTTTTAAQFKDFQIVQAPGVTPTAGGAFLIGSGVTGYYTVGLRIEDVTINNMWGGLYFQQGQISNWVNNVYVVWSTSGGNGCIYYNSAVPSGDDHINDVECNGANTGVTIAQSDTTEYSNLKTNGSGVVFTGSAMTANVRFIDPSIENAPACGFDFGVGTPPTETQIFGGGVGNTIHALCNESNATNLMYYFNNYNNSGDGSTSGGSQVAGKIFTSETFNTHSTVDCSTAVPFVCGANNAESYTQLYGYSNESPSALTFGPVSGAIANQSQGWIGIEPDGAYSGRLAWFVPKVGNGTHTASDAIRACTVLGEPSNSQVYMRCNGGMFIGPDASSADPGVNNLSVYGNITTQGSYGNMNGLIIPSTVKGSTGTATGYIEIAQLCTTGSITPSGSAGGTASGTCTLATSATGQTGIAAANDGTVQAGLISQVSVNGTTATVTITTVIAGSPLAKAYNVKVF
jgi:hypothetical protein